MGQARRTQFDNSGPALRVITPVALAAYARSAGWQKDGPYGPFAELYTGDGKPAIIVPHTDIIDDYALAVEDLVITLAEALEREQADVYRDLTEADRDVIRVMALSDNPDGLSLESGYALLAGARALLIAAAHSLHDDRPALPTGPSPAVAKYLNRIRLAPGAGYGFGVTLVSPALSPRLRPDSPDDDACKPMERRVAERLSQALFAIRAAAECAARGDGDAFDRLNVAGVSANLCETVAGLVDAVGGLTVSFTWALTRPADAKRGPASFANGDVALLREAALELRRVKSGRHRRAPLINA